MCKSCPYTIFVVFGAFEYASASRVCNTMHIIYETPGIGIDFWFETWSKAIGDGEDATTSSIRVCTHYT